MKNIKEHISNIIENQNINEINNELLLKLCEREEDGKIKFIEEECRIWDFKERFFLKYKGEYFGGIIRAILAFHNTHGGILIFGVEDTERTPGHDRNRKINIERVNSALRIKLSEPIECQHKRINLDDDNEATAVDIILVPQRKRNGPPVKSLFSDGKLKANTLYYREGAENLEASSKDIPFLYSTRPSPYSLLMPAKIENTEITNSLPENPATIQTFIGRKNVIELLWAWVFTSKRAPRHFLYGNAGSGKTAIAYEFAQLIVDHGAGIKNSVGHEIDQVIFLTAKSRELISSKGIIKVSGRQDFANSAELFCAILQYTPYSEDSLEDLSEEELADKLEELFEKYCILLIIDDIDTLSVEQTETGSELLRDVIGKTTGSKILYTQRHAPESGSSHAINIPGMELETEYVEFIEACTKQFDVIKPDDDMRDGQLSDLSGRIPLMVEVMIGLRRTCGSYEKVVEAFQGKSGKEAREYMYSREYGRINNEKSKYVLLALQLWNKPVAFETLSASLGFDDDSLQKAILEVNQMFIRSEETNNGDSQYCLNKVASIFIDSVSSKLPRYVRLDETIKTQKKGNQGVSNVVEGLKKKVKSFINQNELKEAYNEVFEKKYNESDRQRSDFRGLRAFAAFKQSPPKIEQGRSEMERGFVLGTMQETDILIWYFFEIENENYLKASDICDLVIGGKGYNNKFVAQLYSRKGYCLSTYAIRIRFDNAEKAIKYSKQSVEANLKACYLIGADEATYSKNKRGTIKSIMTLYNLSNDHDAEVDFFDCITKFKGSSDIFWDPIAESFIELKNELLRVTSDKQKKQKVGYLSLLMNISDNKNNLFRNPIKKKEFKSYCLKLKNLLLDKDN
jgi:hypothetical protein